MQQHTHTEIWRPVVGHEGTYEVSDLGRVRSLPRTTVRSNGAPFTVRGRVLSPSTSNAGGYPLVNLGGRPRYVHQIVAEAFIGPRPEGLEICHRDGDPTNNRPSNLRYDTSKANTADLIAHGRSRNQNTGKTHCKRGHEFSPENTRLTGRGRECRACSKLRNVGPRSSPTHCPRGHEYTAENSYIPPGRPSPLCRTCQRKRNREYMRRVHARNRNLPRGSD